MNPEDSDPTGINEAIEQEIAIQKCRWFRRLWWPFVAALVAGAAWIIFKVWAWVRKNTGTLGSQ